MTENNPMDSALRSLRVLDLTDEKGLLCGKMLGDLGADVVQIEPPGGSPARNIGPFYADSPSPDKGLPWFAFSNNKRSITLNLECVQGREIFKQLAKKSNVVIESYDPGHLDSMGIGYEALQGINPQVILTSITPFGQTGPYSRYRGSDMVCMAMGGHMYMTGDTDRPPVRVGVPQAYLLGASSAAAATLLACYHHGISGEGQHVDVSIQESIIWTMMGARPAWDANKVIWRRAGDRRVGLSLASDQQLVWPCKDGYVTFILMGGKTGAPSNKSLVEWMAGEGEVDGFVRGIDWDNLDMGKANADFHHRVEAVIGKFFLAHSKKELYEGALKRGIMLCPVASAKDMMDDEQLAARGFWQEVAHPELGTSITYPGAFAKLSRTPIRIRRRAPLAGEHNEEVYGQELGFSKQEMVILKESGVI